MVEATLLKMTGTKVLATSTMDASEGKELVEYV